MKRPFFNLSIDVISSREFLNELETKVDRNEQVVVNFLNAHCFNIAQLDVEYRNCLLDGTYLLNDGIGVSIGARILRFSFTENMNGTDLIPKILNRLSKHDKKIYLLGASQSVVERAAQTINADFPGITVVGYNNGYFSNSKEVVKKINQSKANIVLVCMGVPRQELWVARNKQQLTSAKLLISGGAILDFITGEVPRAPAWMRNYGLEWFYRLLQEPKRLFKRYVIGNVVFFINILRLLPKSGNQSAGKK